MSCTSSPLRRMTTQATDVQRDKIAKAQAKKAHQEARQQNINDLAEFEHADMVNEDSSDGKAFNNPVSTLSCSEKSATKDDSSSESADEDNDDPPPAKRLKAQTTQKATAAAGKKAVGKEPTGKKNKTDHPIVSASTDKPPWVPKKKVKVVVKVRDEIKVAGKKIQEGHGHEVTPTNTDLLMDSTDNSDSSANRGVVLMKIVQVGHHRSGPSLGPVNAKPPTLSLRDEGGLSDNDKMRGPEWEAAINSPLKGTSHVTSKQLVVQKSLTASSMDGKTVSKKPQNDVLPKWVENRWFRRTFVTTYMAFVGQTNDPWEVPVRQSV
ncbi:hypothetical protein EDB83DRAFT_2320704 [Lactarius deliciosus]|nr:hypothetical protein EDB83DRAFT_2320704 [Lactarius deliciosus]